MTYINEKHRARFTLAAKNIPKANYALLSALYLLTADQRLWSCCKHHVPPMLFRTICNAMAIRRFGLAAIKENCHD